MPGSVVSVFSEPDEYQAGLRADGLLNMLVTESGQFRARLTRVTLDQIHLSAGDEHLARINFVAVPADTLFVSLAAEDQPVLTWNGMEMRAGEMITLGSGQQIHSRTEGPCHWGAIQIPAEELSQYARALSGAPFVLPPVAGWRAVARFAATAPPPSIGNPHSQGSVLSAGQQGGSARFGAANNPCPGRIPIAGAGR